MTATTEAFARVKIDALLKDAGWNLADGSSVLFEHALPDGTQADYVLCDRRGDRRLLDPCYLFSYTTSAYFVETVASKVRGSNYPAVSNSDIRNIEIILPPLKDQRQFSGVVNAVQSIINLLESSSSTYTHFPASLMSPPPGYGA